MDRLIYVAMSAAQQTMTADNVVVNNLANANTNGFHSDIANFKSMYLNGPGIIDRSYNIVDSKKVDLKPGPINTTGRSLDIALKGNAWLSVTTKTGEKGYLKSASLHTNQNGVLETSQGMVVNGQDGSAITLPSNGTISIDRDGGISVNEKGQSSIVGKLKVDNLPPKYIIRTENGLVNTSEDGVPLIAKSNGAVMSGVLEKSNVSAVESLVKMIDLSRSYETNINMLSTARKDDQASNRLLSER